MKASICIPCYNHAHFLAQAIESVLAQTFADFELVIVDNCSTDRTAELVSSYAARDRRIRYLCNETNVGARENLNRCLQAARGEYVKILCADDLLAPDSLHVSVPLLDAAPDLVLVTHGRQYTDEELRSKKVEAYGLRSLQCAGKAAIRRCLLEGNLIGEPAAVLFRRSAAERGFDVAYGQLIDLEFWCHLLEQGGLAFVARRLCLVRMHPGQLTQQHLRSGQFVDDEALLFARYANQESLLSPHDRMVWRFRRAYRVWMHLRSLPDCNHRIAEIYPLGKFYLRLPFRVVGNVLRKFALRQVTAWCVKA